jgi:hypothetical protein
MRGAFFMKYHWIRVMFLCVLLMMVSIASAQTGGRGGGGAGGRGDGTPRPTRTAPDGGGQIQPVGTPFQIPNGAGGQFQLPETWSNFTLPENLPTSRADIEAMLADMELPITWDLESLALEGGSDEAYAAIVGFAQLYLGTAISPIYADEITTTALRERVGQAELPDEVTQIVADLPAELQQILAVANGVIYWSILPDGAATVYTGNECNPPTCTVTIENLQVNISSASFGTYLLYRNATVTNSNEAYSLIINTYPTLATYGLTPSESESGYLFAAYDYATSGTTVSGTGAIAGVIPLNTEKSLVFALVGIGDGYVELMR